MVGITCKEISGYGRTGSEPLFNERFSVNHSWAAVWLNEKWNLIDVTWGSGYTVEGTTKFVRQRNDWFFFTEPEKFILDHFPKDPSWQLLKNSITWQQFTSYAGISLGARESGVTSFSPQHSFISASPGDQILFTFTSKQPLNTILLISKQKNLNKVDVLEKKDDTYYYNFRVPYTGEYDLQIDLSYIDRSKPGTHTSLIDFVYFINATDNNSSR
jgi:plastocyanin